MTDRLIVFDTTMRDGEQSPGASMTREEKLQIGRQLERMRVDVIEAGFPAASNGDFESVKAVAETVKDSIICGLARASESDVRRAGEAVKPANAARWRLARGDSRALPPGAAQAAGGADQNQAGQQQR